MKRASEQDSSPKAVKTSESEKPNQSIPNEEEMGEFEDPYGDDFESEEEIFEAGEDGEPDKEDDDEMEEVNEEPKHTSRVFLPNRSAPLGENEVMEPDYSTYHMLHSVNVKWPCLSFDILPDNLGMSRKIYPQTMYIVAGSQADKAKDNEVSVLKFSSLAKTLIRDEDDDEDEDGDEDYDADPVLESKSLPCYSTVNRLRVTPFASQTKEYLCASMMENGEVQLWDVSPQLKSIDTPGSNVSKQQNKPIFTIKAHGKVEGYAVDWSPLVSSGQLLTGDISGKIFLTSRTTGGWVTEAKPFSASKGSVEDLQWSPTEKTVFAAGGSDGHVRIWDARQSAKPAISVKATNTDINVMSWNHQASHLLASGYDDGQFGVWDLRSFTSGKPVADFHFHKQAVTSIEWHPSDDSVLAVASEDNTVSLWDLSVEADDEEIAEQARQAKGDLDEIPSQLLFVHWQPNVKEVHWHKQIPGALISTGSDGFSLWKTISI